MRTSTLGNYKLSALMLGTVQFGLPYGVANTSGQPSFREVCDILETAAAGGVNCLDTAPFYGESEEVLGRALRETGLLEQMVVVTKCLRHVTPGSPAQAAAEAMEEEVATSLKRLGLDALPICLTHISDNFQYAEELLKLKERGLVHHIGSSTVNPEGTLSLLDSGLCEAVQLPTNILDRRFSGGGVLQRAARENVAIFVRSTYLQGLILMEPESVPEDLTVVTPVLRELRALAKDAGLTIEELALRYVLGLEGVSCLVVGVESRAQTAANIEIFSRGPLDADVMQRVHDLTFDIPSLVFEPWRWQKRMPDSKVIIPASSEK